MANTKLLMIMTVIISRLIISTAAIISLDVPLHLTTDPSDLHSASRDFGSMTRSEPLAILRPGSADDVAVMVKAAYGSSRWLPVSARGHGHSINGQAHAGNGVVIEMTRGKGEVAGPRVDVEGMYVEAWGGETWADVLRSTLVYGLAPRSWTDYLHLTVGGTLSNGGISGQAFHHGPQLSNVHQLQVVTGKGEMMRCSEEENSELFHAVLGGLGQFGIITKARIALDPAPQMVRWIRVLYSNFSEFTMDQEYLISSPPTVNKFDYVEGFVIAEKGLINNWRSSFFSPLNPVSISSLAAAGTDSDSVLYCLEVTKNYFRSTPPQLVDQEVDALLNKLNFIPSTVFTTDVPYVDFLDRVHKSELKLRSKGLWEVPHPWLNLFVPKSKIGEFDRGVFKGILGNKTSFLRSALVGGDEAQTLNYLLDQNNLILKFCKEANIKVKQYLPHYTSQNEWMHHFGQKWEEFSRMKARFDPRHILASGQRIFNSDFSPKNSISLRFD
ncbi:hypothetical protein V2J09_017071 [Rumex salicifolius]